MRRSAPSIIGGSAPESYTIEKILEVFRTYGFKMEDIKRFILKNTKLLFADVDKLAGTMEMLKIEFLMDDSALRNFLSKDSSSLLSVSAPYIASLRRLFEKLGFTKAQFTLMVVRHPHLLMYSMTKMIKPRFQRYLEIGLSKEEALEMFSQEPSMFGKSYSQNFAPKISWFEDYVGVNRNILLHDWLAKHPAWLQSSLSVYQEKYKMLVESGMSKDDLLDFLSRDGRLMNRNPEDVINKLKIMRDILWKSSAEIVAYPECFSASYEYKLTLRIAYLGAHKKDYQALSLGALLGSSDNEFCQLYANTRTEAYRQFTVWWKSIPREKKIEVIRGGVPSIDELELAPSVKQNPTM